MSEIGAATGPEEFYDALATEYHLLFPDWWAAALPLAAWAFAAAALVAT